MKLGNACGIRDEFSILSPKFVIFRYTLEEPGHPHCQRFYKRWELRLRNGLGMRKEYKGKCVAARRVENISAKYQIERTSRTISLGSASAVETHYAYSEIENGRLLAEHFNYRVSEPRFTVRADNITIGKNRHGGFYCPGTRSKNRFTPKLNEIFQATASDMK